MRQMLSMPSLFLGALLLQLSVFAERPSPGGKSEAKPAEETATLALESKGAFKHVKPIQTASSEKEDLRTSETVERELRRHDVQPVQTASEVEQELDKHWDPNVLKAARFKHGSIEELLTPRREDSHSVELRQKLDELENQAIAEQTRQMRAQDVALAKGSSSSTGMTLGLDREPAALLQVDQLAERESLWDQSLDMSTDPCLAPAEFQGLSDHDDLSYDSKPVRITAFKEGEPGCPIRLGSVELGEIDMDTAEKWQEHHVTKKAAETTASTAASQDQASAPAAAPASSSGEYPPPVITAEALKEKYTAEEAKIVKMSAEKKTELSDPEALGKSPAWTKYKTDFDTHRTTEFGKYGQALTKVAADNGLNGNEQYKDFLAHVLAVQPGHVDDVIKKANAAVTANDVANKDSYEYIDDLERLANGTAVGYNRVGYEHFYGYDQLRAQIEEGHMAPGRAIRLLFPLGGDIQFQGGRGTLWPKSEEYFKSTFAEQIKAKIEKYRSFHFTVCVHASTNLGAQDFPIYHSDREGDHMMVSKEVRPGETAKIRQGVARLLDERTATIENLMKEVMKDKVGVRDEEVNYPPLEGLGMHLEDQLFPSGAVAIIAEDRLHHEGEHMTEAELEHRDKVWKAQCDLGDFGPLRAFGKFEDYAVPMMNQHDLEGLVKSPWQENGSEEDAHRASLENFEEYKKMNPSQAGLEAIVEAYNQGRAEAKKITVEQVERAHAAAGRPGHH